MTNKSLADTNLLISGAKTNAGRDLMSILSERDLIPVHKVTAIDSMAKPGETASFGEDDIVDIIGSNKVDWSAQDIVIHIGDGDLTQKLETAFHDKNPKGLFLDGTGVFATEDHIPLISGVVNGQELKDRYKGSKTIALPHPAANMIASALAPIEKETGIKRIVATYLQSVGHLGRKGQDELFNATKSFFMGKTPNNSANDRNEVLPTNIAFNILPRTSNETDSGVSTDERRIMLETSKLVGEETTVAINAVRVPVFVGDMITVTVETDNPVSAIKGALFAGTNSAIGFIDDASRLPTPADVAGDELIYMCRMRNDTSVDNGIQFTLVADGVRVGTAKNIVDVLRVLTEPEHKK